MVVEGGKRGVKLFSGVYERTIDDKNRLPIPAPYRKILEFELMDKPDRMLDLKFCQHSQGFVWIECLVRSTLEQEIEQARRNLVPRSEEWMIFWFGEIAKLERVRLDAQGRILIPQHYLELARITKRCKIAGADTYFTIWAPDQWELFQQKMCTPEKVNAVLMKARGATAERE